MNTWIAVLVVGFGSYAFRVTPLLLGSRFRLGDRTQEILRHAGMGGMAALLVSRIAGFGSAGGAGAIAAALAAVAVGAAVALRGRSMTMVVVAGTAMYAVAWLGLLVVG